MNDIFGTSSREEDSDWLSVSDLMAGLMVIFLFVAIVFIRPLVEENIVLEEQADQLVQQQERISEIAVEWQETEARIYQALLAEFEQDLPDWNAEIEQETLLVRFNSPEVLFAEGQSSIQARFQDILSDFFPRYVDVLSEFQSSIEEIRIEGHTSSEWTNASPEQAYYLNMALSQARTREVLSFALSLPAVSSQRDWVQTLLTANGLSSSRPILDASGSENPERSRRVEFRIRTTVRTEIVRILREVQ
jgi:outer membrane protein OmpA-like peptidoglycan-associated protein